MTLREFAIELVAYGARTFNWGDMAHEEFLAKHMKHLACTTADHARLWELYTNRTKEPVRYWAGIAWAYGWKTVTLADIEALLPKTGKVNHGDMYEAFDKGVEAYEDTLYFEADVDATDAVDRDVEAYEDQLLIEEYENRNFIDPEATLQKTYWR